MINKQANILFIPTSISGSSAEPQDALNQHGYHRQLIYASLGRSVYTTEGFQRLGRQLADVCRHAYLARQMDAVEHATQLMLALPIADQLDSIARYYQSLCIRQQGDYDGARRLLERLVEEATPQYRARALQIIGATYHESGEPDLALPFYLTAGKAAANCDLLTLVESQRMVAVVRSIHGDHKRALADLERLFPPVRAIARYFPALYYEFLNSLAVELGEAGRIPEAEAALAIALASPFASAYPGWSETRDEIAAKRVSATPSVVAVNRPSEAEHSPQIEPQRQPKRSRKLSFTPARGTDSFQRSIIPIPAIAPIALSDISILDRVLICIGPRAPPTRA